MKSHHKSRSFSKWETMAFHIYAQVHPRVLKVKTNEPEHVLQLFLWGV